MQENKIYSMWKSRLFCKDTTTIDDVNEVITTCEEDDHGIEHSYNNLTLDFDTLPEEYLTAIEFSRKIYLYNFQSKYITLFYIIVIISW